MACREAFLVAMMFGGMEIDDELGMLVGILLLILSHTQGDLIKAKEWNKKAKVWRRYDYYQEESDDKLHSKNSNQGSFNGNDDFLAGFCCCYCPKEEGDS
ncbi:hypothetical protein C1646_768995 [Rhizophagus diaphanus]|nr:hypothetical protein C1646_768995 [Rhizophagus diaphanus] [Rhizophagus sp. MUCL 43196]